MGKWIYIFGGYRTKKLHGQYQVQIDRKNEVVISVTANRIERYDTSQISNQQQIQHRNNKQFFDFFKPSSSETENTEDEVITLATLDNLESWPSFELLKLKFNI